MTEKLKPCPFCGGKSISCTHGITNKPFLFLKCKNKDCGAVVSFDNDVCNSFPAKARDWWNRRTSND